MHNYKIKRKKGLYYVTIWKVLPSARALLANVLSCSNQMDLEVTHWDFPGGAVVVNPPANAGDMVSSPGLGRSHMPQSN